MDSLLIPCFDRPELLWHTLDNLVKTGDMHTVHTVFKPDNGHSPDILTVIQEYADRLPSYEIKRADRIYHKATKQSKNVLEGYRYAASLSDHLVFMVEEDIMVARDFFRYHRAVHKTPVFASLSTRNVNRTANTTDNPEAFYLSDGDYCSTGVCMTPKTIKEFIVPHMNTNYYLSPVKYCQHYFPDSPIGGNYVEQDGLIRRIQQTTGLPTAYPHVPRAFHAGYYGYNRYNVKRQPKGDFRPKVAQLADVIYNRDQMRRVAISEAWFHDTQPVDLEIKPWKKLCNVPV